MSINIFNEKIYIIVWFWFFVLAILTLLDLLVFLFRIVLASQRHFHVKKHVHTFSTFHRHHVTSKSKLPKSPEQQKNERLLKEFTTEYLKPDVILVLKLLSANASGMVVTELVKYLWEWFLAKKRRQEGEDVEENVVIDDDLVTTPVVLLPTRRESAI